MTNEKYQPTKEDLERWERLDELGLTAMCGTPISDEEKDRRIQSVIDGSCLLKYLDKILKQKQEALKKLADLEEIEKVLREKISMNKIS
ncbi:MAG: hypothetical protein AAF378_00025 [Cyanobacteria bacterium P01_A01_bin.84]